MDLHNLNWQTSNDFSPKNIHFKAVKIYPKFISLSVCVRLSAVSSSSSSESMEGVGLEEEEEEEEVEGLMINLVDISTTTLQEGQTPNMSHSELLEDLYFGCYWSVAGFLRRKVWKKANKSTVSLTPRRKVKYRVQLTENSLILHSSKPRPKKSVSVFTRVRTLACFTV